MSEIKNIQTSWVGKEFKNKNGNAVLPVTLSADQMQKLGFEAKKGTFYVNAPDKFVRPAHVWDADAKKFTDEVKKTRNGNTIYSIGIFTDSDYLVKYNGEKTGNKTADGKDEYTKATDAGTVKGEKIVEACQYERSADKDKAAEKETEEPER